MKRQEKGTTTMNAEIILNTATINNNTIELVKDTEDVFGFPYIVRTANVEQAKMFTNKKAAQKYFNAMKKIA